MLTQDQIEQFKAQLLEEKADLNSQLNKIAEKRGGEDKRAKFDSMDDARDNETNADEVEEYTADLAITERLENKLKEVEEALERIENGTYGRCENCPGEEIPVARLEAYPAAKTCIKCKDA